MFLFIINPDSENSEKDQQQRSIRIQDGKEALSYEAPPLLSPFLTQSQNSCSGIFWGLCPSLF
jgi:hypothetical protein